MRQTYERERVSILKASLNRIMMMMALLVGMKEFFMREN